MNCTHCTDGSRLQQISLSSLWLPFKSRADLCLQRIIILSKVSLSPEEKLPWKWHRWHISIGRIITRERGASSKSVKYFTTMTCLASFLDAIASRTKSLKKKQKAGLSTVHQGKSWIEAWNPNPTFSSRGQSLFLQCFSGQWYSSVRCFPIGKVVNLFDEMMRV